MTVRFVLAPDAITGAAPAASRPGISARIPMFMKLPPAMSSATMPPPITNSPPRQPSPARCMNPSEVAHERVADSNPASSVFSFSPEATLLGVAVKASPGPPVSRATRWVTESSPAQPCGPGCR